MKTEELMVKDKLFGFLHIEYLSHCGSFHQYPLVHLASSSPELRCHLAHLASQHIQVAQTSCSVGFGVGAGTHPALLVFGENTPETVSQRKSSSALSAGTKP